MGKTRLIVMSQELRIEKLGRSFGARPIFRELTLTASRGDVVAVVGPNGAGKTTLLRVLATLLLPTKGDAWLEGYVLSRSPREIQKRIGWVPATEGGFLSRLTGRENLGLFASLRGVSGREWQRLLDQWRGLSPLRLALDTPYYLCSAGMRQALHLARALLPSPVLLLLDEPTRSLDAETARWLRAFLEESARQRIVFISTHRPDELAGLATQEIRLAGAGGC